MDFSLVVLLLLLLISQLPKSFSAQNEKYVNCSHTLKCGNLGAISYPFYDGFTRPNYCGYPGYKVNCQGNPQISISNHEYNLLGFNDYNETISVSRNYIDGCPDNLENTTIDLSIFNFPSSNRNITFFYNCRSNQKLSMLLPVVFCSPGGSASSTGYYLTQALVNSYGEDMWKETCKSNLFIPILQSGEEEINKNTDIWSVSKAFMDGFELGLVADIHACSLCRKSGGQCGYDWHNSKFACYCPDHNSYTDCAVSSPWLSKNKGRLAVALGTGFSLVSILCVIVLVFCLTRKINSRENQKVEAFLESYGSLATKRYTYSEIKKMTTCFREKVGQGGFGAVYKGKLIDGRVVAVKLLKQSKGDADEFINEVASIGRANHVNIVSLLGFCYEGKKRALVYEFMINGSLEKFTRNGANNVVSLTWKTSFDISLSIARGLEYMHRGCQTRILHFDIKPHNILLDENFCPEISDFGLAKLYPQDKHSKISMSVARGTVGYMAPEVFSRNFGEVSHKSDVYSYGMMILEVIGSRRRTNIEAEVSNNDLYFPNWIYKQLNHGEEERGDRLMKNEEKEVKRKLILVSLWCIQTMPSSRPSMSRVVKMLEANLEAIEIPPMPSLSSLPRPQVDPSGSYTTTF